MKKLIGLAIALSALSQMAFADHESLERLSRDLTRNASELYVGARQVIGYYPTYRQRYAFEHISFLHTSAHRFEQLVGGAAADDHGSDELIRWAYRRLEHDVYYARRTFNYLFDDFSDDHLAYGRLDQLLRNSEDLVRDIGRVLP